MIESSRYSIHDLSRCQARAAGEHYRLNMPFELGMDFGCRHFGTTPLSKKVILILEEQHYRYQAAISDLAGSDIEPHGGEFDKAVTKVRNWITRFGFERVPPARILADYEEFQRWHYEHQLKAEYSEEDIQGYPTWELLDAMRGWIATNRPAGFSG